LDYLRKPDWLKARLPSHSDYFQVAGLLKKAGSILSARAGAAQYRGVLGKEDCHFLILGNICTRNCAFCAVDKGRPQPLDENEPEQVLAAVKALGLRYVVITSVTRDDLPDGGAGIFFRTIKLIKDNWPETKVEVLVPDFKGEEGPVLQVLEAGPDVLSHNLETTVSLYPEINRPASHYYRSLRLLKLAKKAGAVTKVGLGWLVWVKPGMTWSKPCLISGRAAVIY